MTHPKRIFIISIIILLLLFVIGQVYALGTAPNLGTAENFAVLGSTTVTNTGNTVIMGHLGLSPGSAVTGFPPGIMVPPSTIYIGDAIAAGARADATAAFIDLGSQACDFNYLVPTDLAGMTLDPGVYCFSSSVENSGVLTLDGLPTDVWIFRSGSSYTAGPGSSVVGTGSECNIFWYIGSSATLDTTSISKGTFIANQSISMNNAASLDGRVFALNGAVTLINNVIDVSICADFAPGGVGVTKLFSPTRISADNESTLTITFANADDESSATLAGDFTDILPLGVVVADEPNIDTTCGGIPTIGAGGDSVTLPAGSTIPVAVGGIPGTCTLTVDVTSSTVASYTNTIAAGALTTDIGDNLSAASAVLVVRSAPADDSDLPAFPETGSGAPIFNEMYLWGWVAMSGFSATGLALGIRKIRKSSRDKK